MEVSCSFQNPVLWVFHLTALHFLKRAKIIIIIKFKIQQNDRWGWGEVRHQEEQGKLSLDHKSGLGVLVRQRLREAKGPGGEENTRQQPEWGLLRGRQRAEARSWATYLRP